jgi:cell division protein FtsZ
MTICRLVIGSSGCSDGKRKARRDLIMNVRSIVIVGVGGGGLRVVSALGEAEKLPVGDRPVLAAVDTDVDALDRARVETKLPIGEGRTSGVGAGGDPCIGRLCAQDDINMLRGLFSDANLVFVVTGLGGGIGTGGCPLVLNAARESNAFTICVATLPFAFESEQRRTQAEAAVDAVRDAADLLVLLPNDRMMVAEANSCVDTAFDTAAQAVTEIMSALWRLLTRPGYINLDLGNLQHVAAASGGVCTVGYGSGKGKHRAAAAAEQALTSPLLEGGVLLKRATALAVSIVGSADLTLAEVGDVMTVVKEAVAADADLSMGTVLDPAAGREVHVAVFVSEERFATPVKPLASAPAEAAAQEGGRRHRSTRKERDRQRQQKLTLEASGRGRFKGVHPTVLDGEDLDVPTFMRRHIRIEK